MKPKAFILASVALFALGVSSATAGPCTTEIENLIKVLAAKDAGSGPSPGALGATHSAAPPSDQHPPTAAMSQAAQGRATSAEDVRRQTAGQPTAAEQPTGGPAAQHPPTAAMSQATQSQTAPLTTGQHPPTAAMSEATRTQAAPPPTASPGNTSEASLALNRARILDQQGKEAECMEAVRHAKQLAGATLVQAQAQQTQPQQGQTAPTPSQAQDRLRSDRLPDRRGGAEPDYFGSQDEILAHMETRLARFKEALHLTPDQEKNWPSFQSALRDVLKLHVQRTSDLRDQPPISPVERLRRDADQLGTIAASLKHLADAEEPLYNSLNDGQKERFARLARMARRHLASLAWQGRTDASAGDRSRYRRDERYGWQGRYGRDEDEGWRGRYHWRDHIMNDPDKGWRDHRGMPPRGRMMDDDEEDGAMMGRGRMRDEYDDRTGWRHWDRHVGGWRRYHGRGMMDGWRSRDCEPDRD